MAIVLAETSWWYCQDPIVRTINGSKVDIMRKAKEA
jgi:hypothetical protein